MIMMCDKKQVMSRSATLCLYEYSIFTLATESRLYLDQTFVSKHELHGSGRSLNYIKRCPISS